MEKYNSYLGFKHLYKKTQKKNPLIDFKKFEAKIAFVCSILFGFVFFCIYTTSSIKDINELMRTSSIYIGTALIGMLGFIVGGLAIISGTIGNKVAQRMYKKGVFEELIKILFSFYYIGFVIGINIVLFILNYLITFIDIKLYLVIFISLGIILCYLLVFSIFYSVSLLGTCLNMFLINFRYSSTSNYNNNDEQCLECRFNNHRIDALTAVMIERIGITKEELLMNLHKVIANDILDTDEKEKMDKYCDGYYGNN